MKFVAGGPKRYDHQKRILVKLIETGGVAALLCDPGTGKTAPTLDYCSLLALKSRTGEARVLVVCPLAAVDTWVMQAETYLSPQINYWAEALGGSLIQRAEALAARGGNPFRHVTGAARKPHAPRALHHQRSILTGSRADGRERPLTTSEGPDGLGTDKPRLILEVVNLDTFVSRQSLKRGTMADLMVDAIRRFQPDFVVVDESHKIKAPMGNASRLLARTVPFVRRRALLTGTVMPHGPLDVFGQWRFLDPFAFGSRNADGTMKQATFGSFKQRFAVTGGFMGREVIGYRNLDEMQSIMSHRSIVVKKQDALDLPPWTDVTVPVDLSAAEARAYAQMKKDLAAKFPSGATATVGNRLSQIMRLRQITAGHLPDDNGVVNILGDSKVRTISSIVHDTLVGEKRIVVFSLFTKEIEMLKKALSRADTEVMVISGGTPSEERLRLRKRFGSDVDQRIVLVAQIKTLSLAVNELVTANHAIFGSLSQQRDDYVQARDRLDRIGQTRPVTFWHAMALKTIDEVIYQSHKDRTNLENAVLQHIHSTAMEKE